MPPIPVPMIEAVRGPIGSARERPACAIASSAAVSSVLRDEIAERQHAVLKMCGAIEPLHLRGNLDAAAIRPIELGFSDAGPPVARRAPQSVGPYSPRPTRRPCR